MLTIHRITLSLLIVLLILSGVTFFAPSSPRNIAPPSTDNLNISVLCSTDLEFTTDLTNVSEELRAVHISERNVTPPNAAPENKYTIHVVKIGMGTLWYLLSDQKKESLIHDVHRSASRGAANSRTYMIVCGIRDEITAYAATYKSSTELYYDWQITRDRRMSGLYGLILSLTGLVLFGITVSMYQKIHRTLANAEQIRQDQQKAAIQKEARKNARKKKRDTAKLEEDAPVAAFFRGREDFEDEEEEISPLKVTSIENTEKESFT